MPRKLQTDYGEGGSRPNSRLPPSLSFKRSKLESDEEGRLNRIFYDEKGRVVHVINGSKIYERTDISVSYSEDLHEYAGINYRNVRRYRERAKRVCQLKHPYELQ